MTELIIRYAEPSAVMDRAVIPSEVVGTLVRCKDCKHWTNGRCWGIPFCGDDASYIETEEHDFCSWAKMKGGDE